MKAKSIFLAISGALLICSCTDALNKDMDTGNPQKCSYCIPIEDALTSLESFLIDNGTVKTKGDVHDLIDNCFAVSVSGTKAVSGADSVLYAVNFKDNSGYALLAADTRIQEDIIAVTEAGSVSEEDFVQVENTMAPADDDDLPESEYWAMVESGVLAVEQSGYNINQQCLLYANSKIDSGNAIDAEARDTSDDSDESTNSYVETYTWKTVKEVPRMLTTVWTQSTDDNDIFNKYTPMVGLSLRHKAPAGCVCIALSQIIAYHEFPAQLKCNEVEIDYKAVKQIYTFQYRKHEGTESSKEMLANMCINIGMLCNTIYFYCLGDAYGFAWPSDAEDCLKQLGYENVCLNKEYDIEQVVECLDNGCPVFISAISGLVSGHGWVIDGYLKRDYVSDSGTINKHQTLLHCNWGWHGLYDGYFASGVFNTEKAVTSDHSLVGNKNYNFEHRINTITYDNPNK